MIEAPSEAVMTRARRWAAETRTRRRVATPPAPSAVCAVGSVVASVGTSEPPTITGRSGSTQGARVVSTPATKAPSRASTAQTVRPAISSAVSDPVNFARASPEGSTWTNVCCTVTPYGAEFVVAVVVGLHDGQARGQGLVAQVAVGALAGGAPAGVEVHVAAGRYVAFFDWYSAWSM